LRPYLQLSAAAGSDSGRHGGGPASQLLRSLPECAAASGPGMPVRAARARLTGRTVATCAWSSGCGATHD